MKNLSLGLLDPLFTYRFSERQGCLPSQGMKIIGRRRKVHDDPVCFLKLLHLSSTKNLGCVHVVSSESKTDEISDASLIKFKQKMELPQNHLQDKAGSCPDHHSASAGIFQDAQKNVPDPCLHTFSKNESPKRLTIVCWPHNLPVFMRWNCRILGDLWQNSYDFTVKGSHCIQLQLNLSKMAKRTKWNCSGQSFKTHCYRSSLFRIFLLLIIVPSAYLLAAINISPQHSKI